MRKINQYKTTYYKEVAAAITTLFIGFLVYAHLSSENQEIYVREEAPKIVTTVPMSEEQMLEAKIREYFPRNGDTMVAIAKAESHLDHDAKGWNCYYNEKGTVVYTSRVAGSHSAACEVSQRIYAYSVDCGILQRNYKGQICPKVSIDEHLQEVSNLSRKQGLEAWSAYNNGSYKKYLTVK